LKPKCSSKGINSYVSRALENSLWSGEPPITVKYFV
jgi:hypothetical protein